jgi:hypothetical protein
MAPNEAVDKWLREQMSRPHRHRVSRRLAVVRFVGGTTITAILVALALLLLRAHNDPEFHPPVLSGAEIVAKLSEVPAQRGHTTLEQFMRKTSVAARPAIAPRTNGFMFDLDIKLTGYRRETIRVVAWLQTAGSRRRFPVAAVGLENDLGPRRNASNTKAWIPTPRRSGTFIAHFAIQTHRGKHLDEAETKPFVALNRRFFTTYTAPTYRAVVPAHWRIEKDYVGVGAARHVTLATDDAGMSLLVDTNLGWNGDAKRSAIENEASNHQAAPTYRRKAFRWEHIDDHAIFNWTYREGNRAFTDLLFRSRGDGFGVQVDGPRHKADTVRQIAYEVTRSIVESTGNR